jgi:RNA polymerase sigma-70 factor (sigma-E family)
MDPVAEREFRAWATARQGPMFRTALLLTGHREDAEDLLQVALAKVALHWSRVSRTGAPDAYVRKILYHQLVSWRRLARYRREYVAEDAGALVAVADPAAASTVRIALARALAKLTPKQRAVIVLRFYSDLAESEVAEILSCSVGTVRSQTHRALARLRVMCPELSEILEAA